MDVSIIVIGDEILLGQVTDTNSGFLARSLRPYGWQVKKTFVVGDSAMAISDAVEQAFAEAPVVLVTGGLGPTADDITKPVLAACFGSRQMRFDNDVYNNVARLFKSKGLDMNRLTRNQAMVPDNASIIMNMVGTAPIMWFERAASTGGKQVLVSMPGVPSETEAMFPRAVLPRLLETFSTGETVLHHTIMLYGIGESHLAEHLSEWEKSLPDFLHLAYLPDNGIIRLRLDCRYDDAFTAHSTFNAEIENLKKLVAKWLLYDGDSTPAEILLQRLKEKNLTFASAESCTGGNIAHLITLVPGSSESFLGGVVSYSNSVKTNMLGVDSAIIEQLGAVSEPVAAQMAQGVCRITGADVSVATSGIAGPSGGTPDKPVGTVCHALTINNITTTWTARYGGNRRQIINRATTAAIVNAIIKLS